MFGLGASEMVVVGVVALIVIGPKDLPGLFKTMGEFTGKARGMAREFTRAMEQAADETGAKDIQKTIKAAVNPQKFGMDKVREAVSGKPAVSPAPLSAERQAAKDKIMAQAAKKATERQALEAEAAAAVSPEPAPVVAEPAPKGDA